jgi:hypothetical protein
MHEQFGSKAVAIVVRCSIYASCGCAAAMLFIWLSPRRAFGLTDDHLLRVLEAASEAALLLSILNALFAVVLMARFREARDSLWLWGAIASPLLIEFLTPAFQSA